MRKITDLLKENKRIWIQFEDDEAWELFCDEIKEEGLHFKNHDIIKRRKPLLWIAMRDDMSVAYISAMSWFMSANENAIFIGGSTPVRVNYKKYRNGENNYFVKM